MCLKSVFPSRGCREKRQKMLKLQNLSIYLMVFEGFKPMIEPSRCTAISHCDKRCSPCGFTRSRRLHIVSEGHRLPASSQGHLVSKAKAEHPGHRVSSDDGSDNCSRSRAARESSVPGEKLQGSAAPRRKVCTTLCMLELVVRARLLITFMLTPLPPEIFPFPSQASEVCFAEVRQG